MPWRRQVEPDNVLELGHELRIARALEGPHPVRLKVVRGPDPLHGAQGQAGGFGHGPAGPVRRLARRLAAGQGDDRSHDPIRRARLSRLAGPVAQQPIDAGFGEALLPAPDRRPADPGATRDLRHLQPLGRG
jgi:hypothetical protein